jgi:hypothetical protein
LKISLDIGFINIYMVNVRIKFSLEQVMKGHRGSRDIGLPSFNLGFG